MEAIFKKKYLEEIVPFLMKENGYSNINEVPKIEKIVLNMGLGEAIQNPKLIETALEELSNIACQKAVPRAAKKSISNFKLREGMKIGVSVTLRKKRMYEFLLRFINIALPRMRDFRGISPKAFDGKGNYNMGIKEQIVFPEIDYDRIDKIRGFNISIVTTAKTDKEGHALLKAFGMPFRN